MLILTVVNFRMVFHHVLANAHHITIQGCNLQCLWGIHFDWGADHL